MLKSFLCCISWYFKVEIVINIINYFRWYMNIWILFIPSFVKGLFIKLFSLFLRFWLSFFAFLTFFCTSLFLCCHLCILLRFEILSSSFAIWKSLILSCDRCLNCLISFFFQFSFKFSSWDYVISSYFNGKL